MPVSASELSLAGEGSSQYASELLKSGTVSEKQLQTGDCLEYTFTIQNIGIKSAVFYNGKILRVIWASEAGQTIEDDLKYNGCGTYTGKLQICEGMQSGEWKISRLEFLSEQFFGRKPSQVERLILSEKTPWIQVDFSFSKFCVSGTKADKRSPRIRTRSIGITKTKIKQNGKSKLYLKVKDQSEISYVVCTWKNTSTNKKLYGIMKYNRDKKRYEYTLSGSEIGSPGNLRLLQVEASDRYGNKTRLEKNKIPKIKLEIQKK
jgi:hypothetical protein